MTADTASSPSPKPEQTSEPMPAASSASAPQAASAGAKFNPKILFGAVAALVVGSAIYFGLSVVNTPARVKEQVMPAHQVFVDYNKSVRKVFDDLGSDEEVESADGLERAVQKAQELVKTAQVEQEELRDLLEKMTIAQAKTYKMAVEEYDKVATQALEMEQAAIDTFGGYVEAMKELEDLEVAFSGVGQYLYSDPNKFVSEADKMITQLESVKRQLSEVEAKSPYLDQHNNLIQSIDDQIVLLQNMRDGVKNRSIEKIGEATQKYTESSQTTTKEKERLQDKLEDEVEKLSDQAKDAVEDVTQEYESLQSQYKF